MTKKDMVPYEGSKSHIPIYNFCYLCKERLDTYHDDQDEGWYFLDTRQVRFTKSMNNPSAALTALGGVVNVHTSCLKEIEEVTGPAGSSTSAVENQQLAKVPAAKETSSTSLAGTKRTYVDATAPGNAQSQEESKD